MGVQTTHAGPQTVSDLLAAKGGDVWSIPPDATVYEAVAQMAQKGIGAILVMEGEKLAGILSERDYARKIILKGKSSRETRTSEIMSSPVTSVRPHTTIEHAMALMTDRRIRHLPVKSRGYVIGVISIGDVVKGIIERNRSEIRSLREYIHLQE
jgi:CBS domain-containing protein